jgi:hypothetical protein
MASILFGSVSFNNVNIFSIKSFKLLKDEF